ncbi:MAG: hypothetical protein VCD00_07030 [Candidatus Hydrogenedentota bacterium]
MSTRILSRMLIVAGLLGLGYQTCVYFAPAWFQRDVIVTRTAYDMITHTASYSAEHSGQNIALTIEIDSDPIAPGPDDKISVEEDGEQREYAAQPGETVEADGSQYTIDIVRPWTGILRDPAGEALVEISLAKDDEPWVENLVLNARSEVSLDALEVRFRSSLDESVPETMAESSSAPRWGIQEGQNTIWFDNLLAGAGAETSDGVGYTLVQYRAQDTPSPGTEAAIRVSIEENGSTEHVVVSPSRPHDVIRFEVPKRESIYLTITARGQDGAAGRLGSAISSLSLPKGYAVELPGKVYRIRVDEILPSGASVSAEQSTFYEVVLSNGDRRIQVRQGEAVRIGDAVFRYALDASQVTQRYHVVSDLYMNATAMLNEEDVLVLSNSKGSYSGALDAVRGGDDIVFVFTPKPRLLMVIVSTLLIVSGIALRRSRATDLSSEH